MADLIPTLKDYARQGYLVDRYQNFPLGRYVTLLMTRKTESETIFRTEGSGEGLVKETTRAGLNGDAIIRRVVISKRKQTAVERRTGRELLREHGFLHSNSKGQLCALNTNAPCEQCIDCRLYGYAVGGGGAQKSRVMTCDAFSIGPVSQVVEVRTFNATYDDGTMRHPETGEPSTSISEEELVRPETHFLDMETLKDVMPGELAYVIGNLLRSTRYGAISSRVGRVSNRILAIAFTDCELFSNLELTQAVYDRLLNGEDEPPFPLADRDVEEATLDAFNQLMPSVMSRQPLVVSGSSLAGLIEEVMEVYRTPENIQQLLASIEAGYPRVEKAR